MKSATLSFCRDGDAAPSHLALLFYLLRYMSSQAWYAHSPSLWSNYLNYEMDLEFQLYYILQVAYNVEVFLDLLLNNVAFPSFKLSSDARPDFLSMFIHHVITNLLLLYSIKFNVARVGGVVLLLHDISDVPIDISRICNHLKLKKVTAFFFVVLLCTWTYLRMYTFPNYVIRSVVEDTEAVGIDAFGRYEASFDVMR